jgi:hypothetical protein
MFTVFLRLAIVFLDLISIVLTSLEFKTFKKYYIDNEIDKNLPYHCWY